MYKRLLILCAFAFVKAFSAPLNPHILAAQEGDPSTYVEGVSALTGEWFFSEKELVVEGAEPIIFTRNYLSGDGKGKYAGWSFFPHKWLILVGAKNGNAQKARAKESNGTPLTYIPEGNNLFRVRLELGIANTARGEISARTNLRNQYLERNGDGVRLVCCDKTERFYEFTHTVEEDSHFLLKKEHLPNGNWRIFSYDIYNRLIGIRTMTPSQSNVFAECTIHYLFSPTQSKDFDVIGMNGEKKSFRFSKNDGEFSFPLNKRFSSSFHEDCLYFSQGNALVTQLKNRIFPEGRFIKASYIHKFGPKRDPEHAGKVNALFAPRGQEGKEIPIYQFNYLSQEQTLVTDEAGNKKLFTFSPQYFPTQLEYFDKQVDQMRWDEYGQLVAKLHLDAEGTVLSSREYAYDPHGNILCETISEDFSGSGKKTAYRILRTFDSHDRLIELKEETGKITTFEYLADTCLITAKIVSDQKKIWLREFFFYDQDHLLRRHVVDNGIGTRYTDTTGITLRKIQDITPRTATPFFGMTASIEEKAWDGTNQEEHLLKKTVFHYNDYGKIIKKEIYDDLLHFSHCYEYDYDNTGRLIKEINPLGLLTTFSYDRSGNLLHKQAPGLSPIYYEYDLANRCINEIQKDTLHDQVPQKTVRYNSQGQIAENLYPDGTRERFLYNLDGTLHASIDEEDVKTLYEYDLLGHLISKQIYSPKRDLLQKETWKYDTFHLLKSWDPAGSQTKYSYDCAGRKTQVIYPNGLSKTYSYNSLGQLEKVCEQDLITIFHYDSLDRVVEQREETTTGILLSKETYAYSENGKLSKIIKYGSRENVVYSKIYNDMGQLIEENDNCGYQKTFEYINSELKITTKMPSGMRIVEYFNELEKIIAKQAFSPQGTLILDSHYSYTGQNKLAQEELWKFFAPQPPTKIVRNWQYDARGRVLVEQQSDGKNTTEISFSYTPSGLLKKKILPSNISLNYQYDFLKRLTSISSSDQKISYSISYDAHSKPIKVIDRVHHCTGTRIYDVASNLLEETLLNGLTIKNAFDLQGRRLCLSLPDQPNIRYVYGPKYLKKIERLLANGLLRYKHSILEYDLGGFPIQQSMTEDLGTIGFTRDDKQQVIPKSFWINSDVSYPNSYKDDFDFLLHESIPLQGCQFSSPYGSQEKKYQFDALGRLTTISTPEKEITFSYDFWNRCMKKTVFEKEKNFSKSYAFLYDEEEEIGMVDLLKTPDVTHPSFVQLKIPTSPPINTGDGAIAYELNNRVFVPIHDHLGNVSKILSVNLHLTKESYTYNAYGQEKIFNYWEDPIFSSQIENPWRFRSQRMDEDCGLIFFKNGFYDPMWLQFFPFSEDHFLNSRLK